MQIDSSEVFQYMDQYKATKIEQLVNNDNPDSFLVIQAEIRTVDALQRHITNQAKRQRRL